MADVLIREIAALMDVAGGDQPQIDRAQHVDQPAPRRLRDVPYRGRRKLGIVGRVEIERLVQEQRDRLAVDGGEL
jgi:hypothetical protein